MDIRELFDRLFCAIFPPRCLNCQKVVCYDDIFCEACVCEAADSEVCRRKLRDVPVSGAVAGALYIGGIKKAVYIIKDKPDIRVKSFFAQTMFEEINKNWPEFSCDYVISVPLSSERLKKRGFNQAELLAKELAARLNRPYVGNVMIQDGDSQVQHTLNARQREENARKSFHIAHFGFVKGKIVLLVDDVMTTGATLRTCSSLLLDDGAKAVYIAVAASTPDFAHSPSNI